MDAQFVSLFQEAATSVFEMMVDLPIETGTPIETESAASHDVTGIIGMSGGVVGALELSFPMATAQQIVSRFVGSETDPASPDFADAIGELANMIAGSAKAGFKGEPTNISCPSVVIGPGHEVRPLHGSICVSIPCESECGSFVIRVRVKTPTNGAPNGATADAASAVQSS